MATGERGAAPGPGESVAEVLAKRCAGHDIPSPTTGYEGATTPVPRSSPNAETCDWSVDERTWRATSSRVECLCGNACYAHFCEARAEALAFCGQPDAEPVHRGLNTAALVGQDARTIEIGTFTEYYGTAFVFSKSDGSLLGGYRGDELCGPDEEQKGSGNRQTRGRMHQTCRRAAGQERVDLPTLRLR